MSEEVKTPIKISLEPGTKYAWCTCSHSEKQPFCDGSHRKHNATPSMVFEVEEKKDAWFQTTVEQIIHTYNTAWKGSTFWN